MAFDRFGIDWDAPDWVAIAALMGWNVKHGFKPPSIYVEDLTGTGTIDGLWLDDYYTRHLELGIWMQMHSIPAKVLYKWIPDTTEGISHYERSLARRSYGWHLEALIHLDSTTDIDMDLLEAFYELSQHVGQGALNLWIKLHGEDEMYFRVASDGPFEPKYPDDGPLGLKYHSFTLKVIGDIASPRCYHRFQTAPDAGYRIG